MITAFEELFAKQLFKTIFVCAQSTLNDIHLAQNQHVQQDQKESKKTPNFTARIEYARV